MGFVSLIPPRYAKQPPPQRLLSDQHDDNFLRDQLSTPCLAIKYTYSSIKGVLKDIVMDASHGRCSLHRFVMIHYLRRAGFAPFASDEKC